MLLPNVDLGFLGTMLSYYIFIVVTLSEITAIVSLIASFIYLLGFFSIDFVQSFISRTSHDEWDLDDPHHQNFLANDRTPCIAPSLPKLPDPEVVIPTLSSEKDEEIINSVVGGTISSYLLESRLGIASKRL